MSSRKISTHRTSGSQSGFSLVIISALFIAFAWVSAVMLERTTTTQAITRKDDTTEQLSRISKALLKYYIFHDSKFPCPAATNILPETVGFGVAAADCTSGAIPAGMVGVGTNTAADTFLRGMVPVATLAQYGVDMDDAFDTWGNRIMYVVDRGLTPGGTAASSTKPTITEWNLKTKVVPPNFILISYGADKLGGIPRTAITEAVPCGTTTPVRPRDQNCNGKTAFLTGPANTGANVPVDKYFDDIVSSYCATDCTVAASQAPTDPSSTPGNVYCWGNNAGYGSLGTGTLTGIQNKAASVQMPVGIKLKKLTANDIVTCAVGDDEMGYCWGHAALNTGAGTVSNFVTPTKFQPQFGDKSWLTLVHSSSHGTGSAGSDNHICGVASDKKTYCWGTDAITVYSTSSGYPSSWMPGALGDATLPSSTAGASAAGWGWVYGSYYTPRTVGGNYEFENLVSGGSTTCGRTSTGDVYCWGGNYGGALNRDFSSYFMPAKTAGSDYPCYLTFTQPTYSSDCCNYMRPGWGWTSMLMSTYPSSVPGKPNRAKIIGGTNVDFGALKAKSIFSTPSYTGMTLDDGTTYVWGYPGSPNYASPSSPDPVIVKDYNNVVAKYKQLNPTGSGRFIGGVAVDDTALCTEVKSDGTSGNIKPVAMPAGVTKFSKIASGSFYCGLGDDKKVYCWGTNTNGQLGLGSTGGFTQTPGTAVKKSDGTDLTNVVDVVTGDLHACAVVVDP